MRELQIVSRLGRDQEFLAAAEIARFARDQRIPCRLVGAGCSFLICYLLGVAEVDPIRRQLCPDRFRDPRGRWAPRFQFEIGRGAVERVVDHVS
jgi:error-prone DNA polymerase